MQILSKKLLKFFAKILATEIIKTYIVYVYAVVGGISLVGLYVFAKDTIKTILLLSLSKLPEELLVYHLLSALVATALLVFLLIKIKKLFKFKPFYFIEEEGFKWRVSKNTGDVKESPFCVKHQVELIKYSIPIHGEKSRHSFHCDHCGGEVINVPNRVGDSIHKKVVRFVKAKRSGYAKI